MAISTLTVGLGGTGVLVVRYLKKIYQAMSPEERVPAAFLAIDFDRSALMLDGDPGLAKLEDREFLYLQPEAIQELLRNIDRVVDSEPAWERVLDWFPDRAEVQIPAGEVEANGAGQYRMLGRLGFFLHDELVESAIRSSLDGLKPEIDTVRLSKQKRVILVSSVAGGTGAGMMMDVAYVARRQEGRPRVYAYLLLPEVFQDVDHGGRIFQNAYGSLKEVAYLKDQQIPFQARYYRIPPVDIAPGGEEPLSRIFLFGRSVSPSKSQVQDATERMARAIAAQLTKTLQEKTLAVVSNTVSSSAEDERRRRRTHCFSTAGSALIDLSAEEIGPDEILAEVVKVIRSDAELGEIFEQTAGPALEQAAERLGEGLPNAPPVYAATVLTPQEPRDERDVEERQVQSLADRWKARLADAAKNGRKLIVDELKTKLIALENQAGAQRERETAGVSQQLGPIRDLVLAEFSEESYSTNVKLLEALSSFGAIEEEQRKNLELLLLTATGALGVREEVKRKVFYEKLRKWLSKFFVQFPEPAPEGRAQYLKDLGTLREKRERTEGFFRRLVRQQEKEEDTVRLELMILRKAVEERVFQDNLEAVLKVRAYVALRVKLDELLRRLDERLAEIRRLWMAVRWEVSIEEERSQLPPYVRRQLTNLLKERLPDLLEESLRQAQELEEDPSRLRAKLEELLRERILSRPEFRDARFVIQDRADAESYQEKIYEQLVCARQEVFVRRTPNPQRKGFAFLLVPSGVIWPSGLGDLRSLLLTSATQILECRTQVLPYGGSQIWVYYEELFNPPDHIRNLEEYYRLYAAEEHRQLFHIDRRFLGNPNFREINSGNATFVVTCGNDGCRENISHIPRAIRVCPGCSRPIRSRCGNESCPENQLHRHKDALAKSCPICSQFNHAAWWRCAKHGKPEWAIPIDKPRCPRCIEEHLNDPAGFPRASISVRPDLDREKLCPRCRDLEATNPNHESFALPEELLPYYRNGVNGHDRARYEEIARRHRLPDGFRCPSCRTHLIPVHHRVAERRASP
ncbi:MAG: tubulin-like doman-containing protein [Thermoanaerobaculia bacterium]